MTAVALPASSCLPPRRAGALVRTGLIAAALTTAATLPAPVAAQSADAQRPMTFLDVQELNRPGSWTPSPDGSWMLYTITDPDWREDRSQSDLYVVSMTEGLPSTRRLTFTETADEGRPLLYGMRQYLRAGRH